MTERRSIDGASLRFVTCMSESIELLLEIFKLFKLLRIIGDQMKIGHRRANLFADDISLLIPPPHVLEHDVNGRATGLRNLVEFKARELSGSSGRAATLVPLRAFVVRTSTKIF